MEVNRTEFVPIVRVLCGKLPVRNLGAVSFLPLALFPNAFFQPRFVQQWRLLANILKNINFETLFYLAVSSGKCFQAL